jgi:hypothetical protein
MRFFADPFSHQNLRRGLDQDWKGRIHLEPAQVILGVGIPPPFFPIFGTPQSFSHVLTLSRSYENYGTVPVCSAAINGTRGKALTIGIEE